MDKIVIIMPTYNEAENVPEMLAVLTKKVFPSIKNADMHLLIVDDNSPDGTGDIVKKFIKKNKSAKVHLLTGKKQGLGMAYVRGMEHAMEKLKADAVIEMDGDFQHDPKYLKPMVKAYLEGADYVIGSRYLQAGGIPKEWEFYRRAISYFGNLFTRLMLWIPNLHDVTTGFRLTRVNGVLDKIKLRKLMELHRFAYKIDLYSQSVDLSSKTVEIPIVFSMRTREKSKFNLNEIVSSYKVVILIRLKKSERFLKYATVGLLGYSINAVGLELFRQSAITTFLASEFSMYKDTSLSILSLPSAWAGGLAAEVAIIMNFVLNNFWTFSDKKITSPLDIIRKFLQFNATSLGAVVIQFVVIGIGAMLFGDTALVRQLSLIFSVAFLIVPYNYIIYNLFIWKTWSLGRGNK